MRTVLTTLAVLAISSSLIGCQAPSENSQPGADGGKGDRVVKVQLMPASAKTGFTVKTVPPLPTFRPKSYPDGLVFVVKRPKGATPGWGKVAVTDFVETGGSGPVGTLHGKCSDLGEDEMASDRCRVVFQEPSGQQIVKYSIALYEKKSNPTEETEKGSSQDMAEKPTDLAAESGEAIDEAPPAAEEEAKTAPDTPDLVIDPVVIIMG